MDTTISNYWIILITLGISLFGLLGGVFLIWKEKLTRKAAPFLISFAAGSIIGAAFLELVPEAFEHNDGDITRVVIPLLIGILFFFTLEKFLVWHHHSHKEGSDHEIKDIHYPLATARPLIIIGDALHNFLDGAIIAIAFLTDVNLGIITSIAVVAHEIPQEIGDFAALLHSGMKRGRVLFWNFLGAVVSPLGAIIFLTFQDLFENLEAPLLGFVAGNFIYLALADLVPTIQHERKFVNSLTQLAFIVIGIVIVWQLGTWLPHQ
ncbi:MAG: ZIP family metal transporter [Patescibacteria group bacterium]